MSRHVVDAIDMPVSSERAASGPSSAFGAGVRSVLGGARRSLNDACKFDEVGVRLDRADAFEAAGSEQPFRWDVAVGDSGEDIDLRPLADPSD